MQEVEGIVDEGADEFLPPLASMRAGPDDGDVDERRKGGGQASDVRGDASALGRADEGYACDHVTEIVKAPGRVL